MATAIPQGKDPASCTATNEQAEQARVDAYAEYDENIQRTLASGTETIKPNAIRTADVRQSGSRRRCRLCGI